MELLELQPLAIEAISVVQAGTGVMAAVAEMGAPSRLPQRLIQMLGERMTASAAYVTRAAMAMKVERGEVSGEDASHHPLVLTASRLKIIHMMIHMVVLLFLSLARMQTIKY